MKRKKVKGPLGILEFPGPIIEALLKPRKIMTTELSTREQKEAPPRPMGVYVEVKKGGGSEEGT